MRSSAVQIVSGLAAVFLMAAAILYINSANEEVRIQSITTSTTAGLTPLTIQSQILGLQPLVDEA